MRIKYMYVYTYWHTCTSKSTGTVCGGCLHGRIGGSSGRLGREGVVEGGASFGDLHLRELGSLLQLAA